MHTRTCAHLLGNDTNKRLVNLLFMLEGHQVMSPWRVLPTPCVSVAHGKPRRSISEAKAGPPRPDEVPTEARAG